MYKYIVIGTVALVCSILAVRIKGKILALWLVAVLRYNLRPKFYLFNKNVSTLREVYDTKTDEPEKYKATVSHKDPTITPRLEFHETARVLAAINNPAARLRFETTKKGGLNVRLTEIEE